MMPGGFKKRLLQIHSAMANGNGNGKRERERERERGREVDVALVAFHPNLHSIGHALA